jgi:hypothetical protein
LDEIARVSAHGPLVTVGADGGFRVKIVEQDEVTGQLMLVRRHFFREQTEVRVAVAFLHVAQDLIVRAVLLDDVEDIFDGARVAGRQAESGLSLGRAAVTEVSALSGVQR